MYKFPMGQNPDNTCFRCFRVEAKIVQIRRQHVNINDGCTCTQEEVNKEAWTRLLELQSKYEI